jgi:putative ABC transport system permease protein
VFTYLLMTEGYDPQRFNEKFPAIYDKYYKSFGDQVGGKYTAILQPLADIHFHSSLESDEPVGNIAYLFAFTGIGIFIILLACINYMNLSTAKSVKRSTEIAMKKTLGSGKRALVFYCCLARWALRWASAFFPDFTQPFISHRYPR